MSVERCKVEGVRWKVKDRRSEVWVVKSKIKGEGERFEVKGVRWKDKRQKCKVQDGRC